MTSDPQVWWLISGLLLIAAIPFILLYLIDIDAFGSWMRWRKDRPIIQDYGERITDFQNDLEAWRWRRPLHRIFRSKW